MKLPNQSRHGLKRYIPLMGSLGESTYFPPKHCDFQSKYAKTMFELSRISYFRRAVLHILAPTAILRKNIHNFSKICYLYVQNVRYNGKFYNFSV